MATIIKIEGLKELQASLKKLDGQSQKQLRIVLNDAAEIVVKAAKPRVPRRSGRAAASIKAQSSQRQGKVKAGGARVPYYGWLDFGGSVGRRHATKRPFLKDGRYIYPAFYENKEAVKEKVEEGLEKAIVKAGLR